ncbi:stress-related protein isoform X2 [Phalaenopsis equestris]|uniref:stress-related protein isoform X2 n=1 Tax=Phalaenopsis equestris TaxID=78828 RepID=UPI0009E3764E|nr:stress-related protein isoform X2 [Phalaenopsis equestris]
MADSGNRAQETKLKHLEFVQVAAFQAIICLSSLYNLAKENSGPLRPGVQAVEGTVKAIVAPVFDKIHDVPLEFLKFIDRKVDQFLCEVERYVPSLLRRAPEVARSVAGDVQRFGVMTTTIQLARAAKQKCSPVVQDVYGRCEPAIEKHAVVAWRSLNQLPVIPHVVQIVVPTAAYWTEKYNKAVSSAAGKGYVVAEFLPLVPNDRIAKVFGGEGGAQTTNADG